MTSQKHLGLAIFLVAVFVLVPWGIAASGRWDFYYTLTSVALLSIGAAGVSGAAIACLAQQPSFIAGAGAAGWAGAAGAA